MAVSRPTSPHVTIYSWLITNTLSILHRLTGIGLAFGTVLFVAWLVSAAYYPAYYYNVQEFMSSIPGMVALLGWTVAFYYHLANGIRHLFWDIGKGFELKQAKVSGLVVLVFTAAATAFSWGYASSFSPVRGIMHEASDRGFSMDSVDSGQYIREEGGEDGDESR